MKCRECGRQMTTKRENYRYDAVGLRGITLVDVEVRRCKNCGEHEVVIPAIEDLHRAIAAYVVMKPARLTKDDIRFLRKYLGLSSIDLAEHMGTAAATVSRWEHGSAPIGPQADRLLRLIVVTTAPVKDYSLEALKRTASEEARPTRVSLRLSGSRTWAEARA